MGRTLCSFLVAAALLFGADRGDWPFYGHDAGGMRYSPLTEISRSNVSSLKVAWTFHTGDAYVPEDGSKPTQFEATPLYVDEKLFVSTPLGRVFALDPVTGKSVWVFDAHVQKDKGYGDFANRGVSTWVSRDGKRRIFLATIDARLIALDAATGTPCEDFGDGGTVDLRKGLLIAPHWFAAYEETSPPAVVGDLVIVGSAVADNTRADQPSGEVRAYEAKTGKLVWTWEPLLKDASRVGAANAWSVIAVDAGRKLVYVPTGSPSPDYYGGERPGDDLYANSVVALQAETGKVVWHFQTVHHDLWDYDVATPPILFDLHSGGKTIPAIAIGSKTANLFLLNRVTGKPIFKVEEKRVPASDVPGEKASATQPFPLKPGPVARQHLSADEAFGVTDKDRAWCRSEISKLRNEGIFTPPSLQGTLAVPGNVGGQNWGGMTYDPVRQLLILPIDNLVAEVRLIERKDYESLRESRGRKIDGDWEFAPQLGTPYGMMRRILMSPSRTPCTPPPWGELVAISARTGEKKWEVPFGQLRKDAPTAWGSAVLGGPISTAGGVVFAAGTLYPAVYAFDTETGRQLWKGDLPSSAKCVPMTFRGPDGKQYVVVSAGGFGIPDLSPVGDAVVAFRLDQEP